VSTTLFALTRAGAPADFAALLPLKRFDKGIGENDPFAAQRLIPWQGERRMSIGQVTWQGSLRHEHFPHTELLVVHSGVLVLETDATTLTITAGESVVIPQGNALSIRAASPVCWSFCAVSGVNTSTVQPVQQID
jgi:ethanolamine utilization protein EutQ (cupin superfamily)